MIDNKVTLPMPTFAPKDYQQTLADDVVEILEQDNYAYLEAPTGVGKTLVIGLIAQNCGFSDIIYTVNSLDLVNQTKAEIDSLTYAGLLDPHIKWQYMTWRMYASIARRHPEQLPQYGSLVFVDECHIGGVARSVTPKRAFPAIKNNATKVVWVSATPWALDEAIMGARKGHTAYYSYEEAYRNELLNRADIVRIDCSLNLSLQLSPESDTPRALYLRETTPVDINSPSADAAFEQLTELVQQIMARPLRTTDVPSLVKFRWQLMSELYKSRHLGEKAIFWLPSKEHARECAAYINQMAGLNDLAVAILGEGQGSAEAEITEVALSDWRNPNGATKVACVVYRLREGLNYPHLAIGFDCAWNPYNYRSTVQKIGRLLRRAAGKSPSTYYYAVDAVSIAAASSRRFASAFMERLGESYRPEDLTITASALADAMALKETFTGDRPIDSAPPKTTHFSLRGAPVKESRIALFDVLDADGVKLGERYDLTTMFKSEGFERAESIILDILSGKMPWPGTSGTTAESLAIRPYLTPSRHTFREDWYAELVKAGHLVPNAERSAAAAIKIERIVDDMIAGTRPWPGLLGKTHESKMIRPYLSKTSASFRPDLYERLVAAGLLLPADEKKRVADEKLEEYLSRIERRELSINYRDDIYKFLFKYFNPTNKTFRPDVRNRLIAAGAIKPNGKGSHHA
jgi:superfamily II DNA or RNA helicase